MKRSRGRPKKEITVIAKKEAKKAVSTHEKKMHHHIEKAKHHMEKAKDHASKMRGGY